MKKNKFSRNSGNIERTAEEQRAYEKEIYRRYRRNNSKHLIIGLIVIILGYIFFFTSPLTFHKRSETKYTDIGETVFFDNDVTFKISSWCYQEDKSLMEVVLNVNNKSLDYYESEFVFKAFSNHIEEAAGVDECKVEKQIEMFNFISLWIYDIPKDFNTCALYISAAGADNAPIIQIYTCSEQVERVDVIEKKDIKTYKSQEYEAKIAELQVVIDENTDEINALYNQNKEYENLIKKTKESQQFLTKEEIEQSNNTIGTYETIIENNEKAIINLQMDNTSLYEEIDTYKGLIKDIENSG